MDLSQYVICDGGNGEVGLIWGKNGKVVRIPSVRARVTGTNLGIEGEKEYDWVEWLGNKYVFGDDTLTLPQSKVEYHSGENRYGNEHHQSLVLKAMLKAGVKSGKYNLTLFVPPAFYKDKRDYITNRFMWDGNGRPAEFVMQPKGAKNPIRISFGEVRVIPEGVGAIMAYFYNEHGEVADTDVFVGTTVVMDGGVTTVDLLTVMNGDINTEALDTATYSNYGINQHVRIPIVQALRDQGYDVTRFGVSHVDELIRRGYTTGNFDAILNGKKVPLKDLVLRTVNTYGEFVAAQFIDTYLNGLNGIERVILAGGLALLCYDKLNSYYPGKILHPGKFPHLKKVSPLDLNVQGGFRSAIAKAKANAAMV